MSRGCFSRVLHYLTVSMRKPAQPFKKTEELNGHYLLKNGANTDPDDLGWVSQSFSKFAVRCRKEQISFKEPKIMHAALGDNICRAVRWHQSRRQTYWFPPLTYQHNSKHGRTCTAALKSQQGAWKRPLFALDGGKCPCLPSQDIFHHPFTNSCLQQ